MSGTVIDAAYPPRTLPPGIDGIMGYIGGPKATHVWTAAEWEPFAAVRQFPAYVPDLTMNPIGQAVEAVELAERRGWAPHMPAAETRVIVFDTETTVNRSWWMSMAANVLAGGFIPVDYGSLSTVLENAAADNIVADWDGIKAIPAGQTIHGAQYRANVPLLWTTVDYSVFDGWLMARGGVGPRKGT